MRLNHFETLAPICPVCSRHTPHRHSRLKIARTSSSTADCIEEGLLICSNPDCAREFPIVDGIPVIMPDVSAYMQRAAGTILWRSDLSETTEGLIGDCLGPTSDWEMTRQHLSSYVWDHYGEYDLGDVDEDGASTERPELRPELRPGAVVRLLNSAMTMRREAGLNPAAGPILDLGCGVGRTSFELAENAESTQQLVLGIDAGFAMLRVAQRVLKHGRVRYARRCSGLVYARREFTVPMSNSAQVDFWAVDALALPFRPGVFGHVCSLNVLDSVAAPVDMLKGIARVLRPGGDTVIASPFDWSPAATPVAGWIGGHSDRADDRGDPLARLKYLLSHEQSGIALRLLRERDGLPWTVRLHDRSFVSYNVHMALAAKNTDESA